MTAMTCALVESLQTIPDPRRPGEKLKHPLVDLILLGFWGVLAGGEEFVELAEWGKVNEACFRPFLEVPHGIASPATFTRVFARLQPTTLQEVVRPWLRERRGEPGDGIHRDGKTLRQPRRTTTKLKALPVVSAWAGQTGSPLGQVAVAAKSNEITAMPQLLQGLALHEQIVTTEARGCQKALAEPIVAGGGNSILAVKDNPSPLHTELQAAFAQAAPPPPRSTRDIARRRRAPVAPNTARGKGDQRAASWRRRRTRRGWACSPWSWSRASSGVRRRG
jgi:hypothetical protein